MAAGIEWATITPLSGKFMEYSEDQLPRMSIVWESEWGSGVTHAFTYKIIAYNNCPQVVRFDLSLFGGSMAYNYVEPNSYQILDLKGMGVTSSSGVYEETRYVSSDATGVYNDYFVSITGNVYEWSGSNAGSCSVYVSIKGIQLDKPGDYKITIDTPQGINCWTSTGKIAYIDDPFEIFVEITDSCWDSYSITVHGAIQRSDGLYDPIGIVTIVVNGIYAQYTLTMKDCDGITLFVQDMINGDMFKSGDVVPYGTEISIWYVADPRYSIREFVVNGTRVETSGYSVFVSSDTYVQVSSYCPGAIWIKDGDDVIAHYAWIYDGYEWQRYTPKVFMDGAWVDCM